MPPAELAPFVTRAGLQQAVAEILASPNTKLGVSLMDVLYPLTALKVAITSPEYAGWAAIAGILYYFGKTVEATGRRNLDMRNPLDWRSDKGHHTPGI